MAEKNNTNTESSQSEETKSKFHLPRPSLKGPRTRKVAAAAAVGAAAVGAVLYAKSRKGDNDTVSDGYEPLDTVVFHSSTETPNVPEA